MERVKNNLKELKQATRAATIAIVMISVIAVISTGVASTGMASSIVYEQLPGHYGGYLSGGYSPETGTLIFTVADDLQLLILA